VIYGLYPFLNRQEDASRFNERVFAIDSKRGYYGTADIRGNTEKEGEIYVRMK